MTEQELDHIMRRVLIDSVKADAERDGKDPSPSFEPGSQHKRQMRAMLADPIRWLRRRERPWWREAARRAAVFFLTCIVAFGGVMAISPTARAVVVRWVVERDESSMDYRYTGEQNAEPLPPHEIAELPDGYAEAERYTMPSYEAVVYENANGEMIYFTCAFMHQGALSSFTFNAEDTDVIDVKVNDLDGCFFQSHIPGNSNTLTWIDPELNIQFTVDGCLEYMELLHMAESISLCKTTK